MMRNHFMQVIFGENEDPNRRTLYLMVIQVAALLLGLLVLMLSNVSAQTEYWLCDVPAPDAEFVFHGRQAVWDAMDAGLVMRPAELKFEPLGVGMYYLNETKTAGYYIRISKPANQRWVFVYPELDPPTQPQGIHDFCVVWVYSLEPE